MPALPIRLFILEENFMDVRKRRWMQIAMGIGLFLVGSVAGSALTQKVSPVNRFGQPKTVIHVVAYKFRDATSQNDQEQAINGIRDMAGKIPGIKNIWLKTERNQLRDWSGVYVIEFASPEAAADYAESPLHETWRKKWEALRETSVSFQISN
jgi:Stress responsive A/B Barrel Domain